jgi:hypothetical protein
MNTKEKIRVIMQRYSHIIPNNKRINCYDFANELKKHYSLNNPIVNRNFNFIRDCVDIYWEKSNNKIKVIKI